MKTIKGAITVSLSWVFMAVVGTFFIVLAYNIISTYQDNEEAKFDIELKQNLRTIFNNVGRTAGIEENSLEPIGPIFADKTVELLCVDGLPILSLDGTFDSNNQFLQQNPTFMTKIEQGRAEQTYLAVESFRLPFKTTNMLGIVSKRNVIVLDSGSDISDELVDKIRRSSYRELTAISQNFDTLVGLEEQLDAFNPTSVSFVSDRGRVLNGISLSSLPFDSYHVEIEEISNKNGIISITDAQGNSREFDYLDGSESYAVVTMAMFSDPDTFECSYNLVLDSLLAVYDFYIQKTEYFENESSSTRFCSTSVPLDQQEILYAQTKDKLIELRDQLENEKFNNGQDTEVLIDELFEHTKRLEEFNCAYIY